MRKTLVALLVASAVAGAPVAAQAGLIKKAFMVGSIVVGGIALSKAAAQKHCAASPQDPQCAKVKGTDAEPVAVGAAAAPTVATAPGAVAVATPKPARDPNAMIDAGAAKAKSLAAKTSAWIAQKKAEHDARKAAKAAQAGGVASPAAVVAAPAPTVAK